MRRSTSATVVSVLNREPMGMKHDRLLRTIVAWGRFSAQPRADGDEAREKDNYTGRKSYVSVLNREPMGMKRDVRPRDAVRRDDVSVLNREPMGMKRGIGQGHLPSRRVSVLNREPMGMKPEVARRAHSATACFSAQPRADGDEAGGCSQLLSAS